MMTDTLPTFDPDFASPAEWARMYRACGLQVVPAPYPMRDKTDKRPALTGWREFQKETVSDGIFNSWFPETCKPNMGVITGNVSGRLMVIDLDDYKGGQSGEWWLSVTGGIEPETPVQITGGGGRQYLFRVPEGFTVSTHRTPIADIRCEGGFAMLPPSKHMSGKEYEWAPYRAVWECEIAEAPRELVEAVIELIESHRGTASASASERTANPATDFDSFGNRIDGREEYMRDVIWAAVLNLHRKTDGVLSEDIAKEAFEQALETYLRGVRTRLEGVDNITGLEREGRGPAAFLAKWQGEMRKWTGKVATEAAKPSPRPFEGITTNDTLPEPPPRPVDPETGKPLPLILSAAQFVAGFRPPEYLIDGMIQRGYLYSLTARTGHGKTAVSMYLAQAVARGLPVLGREVEQGAVLFLAGENPDDVRARFLVLADSHGFNPADVPIHFIAGVIDIEAMLPAIREEAANIPNLMMVIVDTAAAYFKGDDGNSNAQQGAYARLLRQLATLPGKPAVIVPSHPIKNASKDNLSPVGGGAFLNEVDGNLTLWANAEKQTVLHWQGKFRGPEFEPLPFRLDTVTSDNVVDGNGVLMPSVVAVPISERELEAGERAQEGDENTLLKVIGLNKGASVATLAKVGGFVSDKGEPRKSTVFRIMRRLAEDKFIEEYRKGKFRITQKGRKELGWDDEEA